MNILTPEKMEKIKGLIDEGATYEEIRDRIRCSERTIRKVKNHYGIETKRVNYRRVHVGCEGTGESIEEIFQKVGQVHALEFGDSVVYPCYCPKKPAREIRVTDCINCSLGNPPCRQRNS